jgi:hydroxypyruvate reductase
VLADPAHALPSPDHPAFADARVSVVARPMAALEAAASVLAAAGYAPVMLGDAIEGEARLIGAEHAALALEHRARGERVALISGGECTVRLQPDAGLGGPNAEYLMALAVGLAGQPGISALAVDTDGIDGSGDNAGAVIGPETLARAAAAGIDWRAALDANRSYDSFAALGDLVITGPTFSNVNDLRIILIDP